MEPQLSWNNNLDYLHYPLLLQPLPSHLAPVLSTAGGRREEWTGAEIESGVKHWRCAYDQGGETCQVDVAGSWMHGGLDYSKSS